MTMVPFNGNISQSLKWLQNNAPNIQSIIAQKKSWYAQYNDAYWDNWEINVFDLRTANPFGIMVWCIILDVPASLFGLFVDEVAAWAYGPNRQNFIYSGIQPVPDPNLLGGNFFGGGEITILNIKEARWALMLRYAALTSSGRVKSINEMLAWIFNGGPWTAAQFANKEYVFLMDSTGVPQVISGEQIFRNDWQGNKLMSPNPRTNLAAYSEYISTSTGWGSGALIVDLNSTVAPDGSISADTLTATSSDTSVTQGGKPVSALTTYTFSIYLKAPAPVTLSIFIIDAGGGSGNTGASCNVTTTWQRFSVTRQTSAGTTLCSIQIGGSNSFTTGESIQAWGAQFEIGSVATPYVSSTETFVSRSTIGTFIGSNGLVQTAAINGARIQYNPLDLNAPAKLLLEAAATNLLLRSAEFNDAAWTKVNTTVTIDAIAAPTGVMTADKLVENTANGGHYIEQSPAIAAANTYTRTWFVKAAEKTTVRLEFYSTPTTSIFAHVTFNLTTGVFSGASVGGGAVQSFSAQQLPDGWWRVAQVITLGGSNTSCFCRLALLGAGGSTVYTGDGVSGLYMWGAGLEQGSFPTSYIATTSATVTRAADVSTSAATTTTDYVLDHDTGEIEFDFPPVYGADLTWTGTWGQANQSTPAQFGEGNGTATTFQLSPPQGNLGPVDGAMKMEYRIGANFEVSTQFLNIMNSPQYGIMPSCAGVKYEVIQES